MHSREAHGRAYPKDYFSSSGEDPSTYFLNVRSEAYRQLATYTTIVHVLQIVVNAIENQLYQALLLQGA